MSKGHLPQLDALRAFAVTAVLVDHTMGLRDVFFRDAGAIGVTVFFVLSGFLITGILLRARDDAEAVGVGKRGVLLRFYIRRALRIWPLYFGVLAVAMVLGDPSVRTYWPWLISFSTNLRIAQLGHNAGIVTLYWSLAVEEQFYLMWPLVVLFAPRRALAPTLVVVIVGSVISRTLLAFSGAPTVSIIMPKWSIADGLGLGSALALGWQSPRRHELARWALGAGLTLMVARLSLQLLDRGIPIAIGMHVLPWSLVAVWLVEQANMDRLPTFMRWRPLVAMGAISFGIYVYHRFVATYLYERPLHLWRGSQQPSRVEIFLSLTVLTTLVASASWRWFERPINELKARWPYVPAARPLASVPSAAQARE